VPAVLLAVAIVGLLIGDPAERAHAVSVVATVFPPLHDLVEAILAQASRDPGTLGIIGIATLAWGSSRFVLAFGDAIARVMGRTQRRGVVVRNASAIGAVLLLALAIVGGATLAGVASFLDIAQANGLLGIVSGVLRIAIGALPPLVTVAAIGLVYRLVPVPAPRWGALWPPALAVGIALTVLIQVFVFLAPRLIGAAALLGTIAAVFAALAWLGLSFQALLIGAAWVREREPAATPPPDEGPPAVDPSPVETPPPAA